MHKTHTRLTLWFWANYLVSRDKRGLSALSLANLAELDDGFSGTPGKGDRRGRSTTKSKVIVGISLNEDFRSYNVRNDSGYQHTPIVVTDQDASKVLLRVYILISKAKSFIDGTFHGLSKKHFQRDPDEFCSGSTGAFGSDSYFTGFCMPVLQLKFSLMQSSL